MIPPRAEIARLHAELCSGIADPNRIAILYALAERPSNVTSLTESLRLPQSTVSRHLRILRSSGLVSYQRQGREVMYELRDRRVIQALELMRELLNERLNTHSQLLNQTMQQEAHLT